MSIKTRVAKLEKGSANTTAPEDDEEIREMIARAEAEAARYLANIEWKL